MEWDEQTIRQVCQSLLERKRDHKAFVVSVTEFREFYKTLWDLRDNPPSVSLVNLQTVVKGQFSDVSPQHFDIISDKPLLEEDFEFIHEKQWYGPGVPPQRFVRFLWGEFKLNWWKLLLVFSIATVLLALVDDSALYELVGTFLIQSTTVFLSLYLIFTVTQSQIINNDKDLFKSGILHRYYNDDRNVTLLGILTVALTFLSAIVVKWLEGLAFPSFGNWLWWIARIGKAISTAIVIALLFDTFFAIADYYLERSRDITDRNTAARILDDDYTRLKTP